MKKNLQIQSDVLEQRRYRALSEALAEFRAEWGVELEAHPIPLINQQYIDEYVMQSNAKLILVDASMLGYLPHLLTICPQGCRIGVIRALAFSGQMDKLVGDLGHSIAQVFDGIDYAGGVLSSAGAEKLSGGGPILQIRGWFGGDNPLSVVTSVEMSDPLFEDEEPFYRLLQDVGAGNESILYWESDLPLRRGYTYKDLCYGQVMTPSEFLDAVVALDREGSFAFLWESEVCDAIRMSAIGDTARSLKESLEKGTDVKRIEVYVNGTNYDPRYYLKGDYARARLATLGELAYVIRRGTTLSAKNLDMSGVAYDPETRHNGSTLSCIYSTLFPEAPSFLDDPEGLGVMRRAIYEDDLYYLDTSSLLPDNKFAPQVLREIPENQERYTVTPEDGTVLLYSRNGDTFSFYHAPVPTLISNALFIVKFKDDGIEPDYMRSVMQSYYVRSQLSRLTIPLSKKPLSQIAIPLVDKKDRDLAIENNANRVGRIAELRREAEALQNEDSFSLKGRGLIMPGGAGSAGGVNDEEG